MKYCFYETTNLVNGKKYLGIHGSEDFQEWWKVNCKIMQECTTRLVISYES